MAMQNGIITRVISRGLGFIRPESEERDVFFHLNDILNAFDRLTPGQAVTFELLSTAKGPQAKRISLLGEPLELTNYHELVARPPIVVARALQECTSELVEHLTRHPHVLRDLHPGTFENLVATIFRHEGFDTERISSWNEPDGGVDLIAVRHLSPGVDIRLAIQCKRWSQSRRLSAEPIRALAGVMDRFRAHCGVVATTGEFSEEAREETSNYLWNISLLEFNDILAGLSRLRLTQ